jgi:hypothetical protein
MFKVGDKVRYIGPSKMSGKLKCGDEGEVVNVFSSPESLTDSVDVKFISGCRLWAVEKFFESISTISVETQQENVAMWDILAE